MGFLAQISSYLNGKTTKFFYRIGQFDFNLDEIKHGLLRDNQKSPSAYMACMSSSDERLGLIQNLRDPRINFICLDSPNYVEHIDPIDGSSDEILEKSMNDYVSSYLNAKVQIDLEVNEIELPYIMNVYRSDFGTGTDSDLMSFVFPFLED